MAKSKKKPADEIAPQAEVHKMVFASAQFDSEEKVTEYLEAKHYSDFEVKKTKDGYEVIAKDADAFEGETKEAKIDNGVTVFLGRLKEGEEKIETKEAEAAVEAAKAAPLYEVAGVSGEALVKKYHDYCATYIPPQGKTIAEVLTEQFSNGSFPAFWELSSAFTTALFNIVKSGETGKVKGLTDEFAAALTGILAALKNAGVDVTEKSAFFAEKEDPMTKENKGAAKPAEAGAEAAAKDTAEPEKKTEGAADPAPAKAEDKGAEGAAPAEADKKEDKPEAKAEEKAAAPANEIAAIVAQAMTAAVAPLLDVVNQVKTLATEAKQGLAELQTQVSKTEEKVGELETARHARKSAEVSGVMLGSRQTAAEDTKDEESKKVAAHATKMQKNLLGIS